ncbi:MAG: hypothetical protein WBK51_11975 [Polaromonas sp.]
MTLTVRLESSTENALTHFCDSQALSKSQVVHQALNHWLKAQSSGKSHALLAFVPQRAGVKKSPLAYEPYSKAGLRAKVASASKGKLL